MLISDKPRRLRIQRCCHQYEKSRANASHSGEIQRFRVAAEAAHGIILETTSARHLNPVGLQKSESIGKMKLKSETERNGPSFPTRWRLLSRGAQKVAEYKFETIDSGLLIGIGAGRKELNEVLENIRWCFFQNG